MSGLADLSWMEEIVSDKIQVLFVNFCWVGVAVEAGGWGGGLKELKEVWFLWLQYNPFYWKRKRILIF
jgi:hypothetical protein